MSKTITWEWFMANRHLNRVLTGDGRFLYSASITLEGKDYFSSEFEYLPDADANLIERIASEGYTVDGYTPPEDSPTAPITHDPEVRPTREFRDDQVMRLHSEGMTDKEVADELIQRIAKGGYTVGGLTLPDPSPTHDPVNNPEHYTRGGIECIDAIEAALTPEEFRGFCKGNALKYIWRAEHKGKPKEDLKKSIWYLKRLGGEYDG